MKGKMLGNNHTDAATLYNNIADVYSRMGEHEKELESYNKALAIKKTSDNNPKPLNP